MTYHNTLTSQHQIHDDDLVYADEATLLVATPDGSYYHKFGYATSERTYWLWTVDGWQKAFDPQAGSELARAVVNNGDVVTHDDEIVFI